MDEASEEFLQTFYRALVDRPLELEDGWYVPIYEDATVSCSDPVKRLARVMSWAPRQSAQLLGGFRGTGKSTELRRLRRLLEGQGFEVVLCDMKHYLDMSTPIEISDFLISAAGALGDGLADIVTTSYWQRAAELLARFEVELGDLEGECLKAGLREDPAFRRRLQERMKGDIGGLVEDVQHCNTARIPSWWCYSTPSST